MILDAGCGTAESCSALAHAHPQAWILGVDQSLHRLGTEGVARPDDRMVTARAELGDLFRLWRVSGRRFEKVYFLYPNPWPKPEHLFRRWHGHPAFPDLLACSAALEARSNWRIYLEEMELALTWFLGPPEAEEPLRAVHRLPPGPPISPFERKYARSGQALFRLTASFDLTPPAENSGPRG
ncbi:MAG: SAM-dependent methyltransferase [Myxococcota bacterium]